MKGIKMKQIVIAAVFLADGSLDVGEMDRLYFEQRDKLAASLREDFDTVAVDVFQFFLDSPGKRSVPTPSLTRAIWEKRVESGALKGKSQQERDALYDRLCEVLPEYVKSNPDIFHMGRKSGISVYYVPGDFQKDKDGNDVLDKEGNPVQAYRHTPEEWAKLTAKKSGAENGAVAA